MQKASDTHPLLTFPQMPYMALYFTILYAIMQFQYLVCEECQCTTRLNSHVSNDTRLKTIDKPSSCILNPTFKVDVCNVAVKFCPFSIFPLLL